MRGRLLIAKEPGSPESPTGLQGLNHTVGQQNTCPLLCIHLRQNGFSGRSMPVDIHWERKETEEN